MEQDIKNFMDDGGRVEAIKLLMNKIRDIDTVQGEYPKRDRERMIEFSARRKAILLVEGWVSELFQIKKGEWKELYSQTDNSEFTEHDSE